MPTPLIEATSVSSNLRDIRDGGCAAWQLPYDPRSPALARSYFVAAAAALDLPGVLIDDGTVAVSELATNAHQHAGRDGSYEPLAPPELWIYPRTFPCPQLVVTVFDTRRDRLPQIRRTDLLDEHGKGLGIVAALSADTDIHPSRSRVGTWPVPGKAAWFALALPRPWTTSQRAPTPAQAAAQLQSLLASRGRDGVIHADRPGVSLVSVRHGLNIWAEPGAFSFTAIDGTRIRRPLTDLQDVAETIVHQHEHHGLTADRR